MTGLVRSLGPTLAGIAVGLTAFWLLVLILVPQAMMIEQSLWSRESRSDLSVRIDRAYSDLELLRYDLAGTTDAAERARIAARIAEFETLIPELEAEERSPAKIYGLQNYTKMSGLHFTIFVKTIVYALAVTLLALIVCYPVAYFVAQVARPGQAAGLLLALTIPYAINELLRIYAWLMILDYQGVINSGLAALGLVSFEQRTWIPFLEYPGAVFLAMIYTYILFMVFPIYNTLETLDRNQIEAARDLGASAWRTQWRIAIPHAKPGIAVGFVMTFMLSAGSYSVPQIMTRGRAGDWFSQLIYRQFYEAFNWNVGSAYAFSLLAACLAFVLLVMTLFRVGIRDIAR